MLQRATRSAECGVPRVPIAGSTGGCPIGRARRWEARPAAGRNDLWADGLPGDAVPIRAVATNESFDKWPLTLPPTHIVVGRLAMLNKDLRSPPPDSTNWSQSRAPTAGN